MLSENWEASHECKVEYRTAENLNKQIFVARLQPSTGDDLTSEWQRCDLFGDGPATAIDVGDETTVSFSTEGLYRLRDGIRGAGIGADSFVWPPPGDSERAPYRGWEPLDEADAAVFFGRDAQIVRALDTLRGMRTSGVNALFVVLGPSGTGKSSFLRAGLLPRLRREDRRFLLMDIVRPERNAMTGTAGLAAAISATRQGFGLLQPSLGAIKQVCSAGDIPSIAAMLAEIRREGARRLLERGGDGVTAAAPTLVLPVDQAEELFAADAGSSAEDFLRVLAGLAETLNVEDLGFVVAATIRTDRYEVMQTHPSLAGLGTVLFDELKPMPATQFKEVITGPAQRASESGRAFRVAPDLVDQLLSDASGGADTLPILALTLSRLYTDYGSTGELTLQSYRALGGMRRVVQSEIDEVLATDPRRRTSELVALRSAFIPWLATINADNDQPMRRVARWSDLPTASRPLIDALVAKRLMVKDNRDGQVVAEVALESLLRQWDELAGWLREERKDLKDADDLERAAAAWDLNNHNPSWLLEGSRLSDATKLVNEPGFRERLVSTHAFLSASFQREQQRRAAEDQQRQGELHAAQERAQHAQERQATAEAHSATLRTRSRVLRLVLAATVVVAIVAAIAGVSFFRANGQAESRFQQATSQRLVSEAQAMLGDTRPGGDDRAFQQLLAAQALAESPDNGALYSAATNTLSTRKIMSANAFVNSVSISPDYGRIASAGSDNSVRLWDATSGQPVGEPLTGHTDVVWSVAFSPDGESLVSGSADGTVRLWDVESGDQIGQPLTGHRDVVRSVAFSPDGEVVASGSFDRTIRLWDVRTEAQIGRPLSGHQDRVTSVAFSPDGSRLASGSNDRSLRLWDVRGGAEIGGGLASEFMPVNAVEFSHDGATLVSGTMDGRLQRWNPRTGAAIGEPVSVSNNVIDMSFSRDDDLLAVGGSDTTIEFWRPDLSMEASPPLTGHESAVFGVAFGSDDSTVISGSRDRTVRVWDRDADQPIPASDGGVTDLAISPAGDVVAVGGIQTGVRLWDITTKLPQGNALPGAPKLVTSTAFSPDGTRIAAGLADGTVRLWDAETLEGIGGELTVGGEPVWAVAFSPDGERLAAVSTLGVVDPNEHSSTVTIWDAQDGRRSGQRLSVDGVAASLVFDPQGNTIALAGTSGFIQLWDAKRGSALGDPLDFPQDTAVPAAAFSPDGTLLATVAADSSVRLWDVASGQPAGEPLSGHQGEVDSVSFTPDGRFLATGGADSAVRLWDVAARQAFGDPLTGHTKAVMSVEFTPDGQRLVSGSADGTVRIWPATAGPEQLCGKLTENMSRGQWNDWVSPDIEYVQTCPDLPIAAD